MAMKLQTPVTDLPCRTGISYGDRIMMAGSCFSDNIGRILQDYGFNVCVNPFGTLYNPVSVTNALRRLEGGWEFTSEDCVRMGSGSDLICSFQHHTSFARRTEEEFLENANRRLTEASDFYRNCNRVIITLGTSWCFRNISTGETVSNCLKRNPDEFSRYMLDAGSTARLLEKLVSSCSRKFIFTVSPIRHMKDGAHGNQISKGSLLLAIDEICARYPDRCDYFPAYEIMMDELRDYRFYAEDMVHPSEQAVKYIGERFLNWSLPISEHARLEENIRLFRRSRHIQMH